MTNNNNKNKEKRIMASPIEDTPILKGKDARRFEKAIENVVPLPKERVEEILNTFNEVKKHCEFSI